jgi:hypothetical protein
MRLLLYESLNILKIHLLHNLRLLAIVVYDSGHWLIE